MIGAVDNTFLTLILNPDAKATPDPATGKPAPHIKQKIEAFIDQRTRERDQIVIPAPTLAEALSATPDIARILTVLNGITGMEVVPFNSRSAIELAEMNRQAPPGDKRHGGVGEWQKVKLDRQIVASAKAHGAEVLYTDDPNQTVFAERVGLKVVHTWDLPLPPDYQQRDFIRDEADGK